MRERGFSDLSPPRQYGRTGLLYRIVVGCSRPEQSLGTDSEDPVVTPPPENWRAELGPTFSPLRE